MSLSLHHVHPAWTGRSTCSKGWSFLVWLLTWMVSMLGWCLYTCLGSPAWLLVSWCYIVPSLFHFVVRFWDCLFFLLHLRLINYWRVSGTYSEFSCHVSKVMALTRSVQVHARCSFEGISKVRSFGSCLGINYMVPSNDA